MVLLGCIAVVWGSIAFHNSWSQSSVERAAKLIIYGDPFKFETLAKLIPTVEAIEQARYCRPAALRSAAIIRLRMADDVILAGKRDSIDSSLISLRDTVRRSLACSPADPFLWLVLFWSENAMSGLKPDNLEYLRMSYLLGPNEGWIALKRNVLALAVFERLPPDLADMAIGEFASLLNSGFQREVVAIFKGPGWRIRDRLLPSLKDVAEIHREGFARTLYFDGYDIDVPGIKKPNPRAWH